jgi:3-hydroxybutyrate dehydrogenase
MKLDDKIALITARHKGIGFGIAKRFGRAGSRLAIADLNLQTASDAAVARNPLPPQPASAIGASPAAAVTKPGGS